MSTLTRSALAFLRDEDAATTAEYGIIVVVVAGLAILVLAQLNTSLTTLYDKFSTKVNSIQ
ncbi:MAG TPA: Flp family type IVb pilin [Gemmatimonadaceae bacterium]|jgi:Flp pilus assembly pilin Flp|nr:Flp family type IVb pilin [Gemmatimonadaceae bacterium]